MSDDERELTRDDLTDPVEIAERPGPEAWLLAGRLRTEGIPAVVFPPPEGSEFGTALQPLRSVLVPRDRAAEAAELVRAIDSGELGADDEDDLEGVDGDDG